MANKMKIHQQDCPNSQKQIPNPVNTHQGPSAQNSQAKRQNKKSSKKNNSNPSGLNQFQ